MEFRTLLETPGKPDGNNRELPRLLESRDPEFLLRSRGKDSQSLFHGLHNFVELPDTPRDSAFVRFLSESPRRLGRVSAESPRRLFHIFSRFPWFYVFSPPTSKKDSECQDIKKDSDHYSIRASRKLWNSGHSWRLRENQTETIGNCRDS